MASVFVSFKLFDSGLLINNSDREKSTNTVKNSFLRAAKNI